MSRNDKHIVKKQRRESIEAFEKGKFEFHLFFNWVMKQAVPNAHYIVFFTTSGIKGDFSQALELFKAQEQVKTTQEEINEFVRKGAYLFMPDMTGQMIRVKVRNHGLDNIIDIREIQAWEVENQTPTPIGEERWKALNKDENTQMGDYVIPPSYGEDERSESLREVSPEIYESNMKTAAILARLVAKLGEGHHQIIHDMIQDKEVTTHSVSVTKDEDGSVKMDPRFEEFTAHLAYSISQGLPSPVYSISEQDNDILRGRMWMGSQWVLKAVEEELVLTALAKDILAQSQKNVDFTSDIGDISSEEE